MIDPIWSASFVLINWDLYWYYGDVQPLSDNYAAMKAWLGYFRRHRATGYIYTGGSYADWLAPGYAQPPEGTRLAGTAYIHKTTTTMAAIARALGHDDDAARFDTLAGTIANAFNAKFFDAARCVLRRSRGGLSPDQQPAAVEPRIVPERPAPASSRTSSATSRGAVST